MAPLPDKPDPTLVAVDAAIEDRGNAQLPRPYLGMSEIGRSCARALWYGFRWASARAFDAATLRRFEDGHRSEDIMADRLRAVPEIALHTEDPRYPDHGQIACVDHAGHFRGHLDGVIAGLLQAPSTPHVWEHKATNEQKQAKLESLKREVGEKQALAKWDAAYYAQHVLYMCYQDLKRGYLTCDSPGSRKTVSVRTDADPEHAQQMIDKAERIIFADAPPPRISDRPDWYECRWCSHHGICHDRAIPVATCRTCAHSTPERDGDGRWSCAWYGCDLSTDAQRRSGTQCPQHIFHPSLMPREQIDASSEQGWIEYRKPDGTVIRNGPGGYASRELHANPELCGDAVVGEIREVFGAEVIG